MDETTFLPSLFSGRVAVVTGGTSGLGAATARVLARLGADVYAVGLGADASIFADARITAEELDVTDDDALTGLFARLDRLDILVPAAGISMGDRELEWEAFQRVVSIQLLAVYRTIDLARPLLARSRGSIITIASMYSTFGGGSLVAYSTSKGGIVQMTKSLAEAYAPDGIRVNSIAPGWIDTPLLTPLKDDEVTRERLLSRTPMRRFGDAEEIGQVVAFLASEAASFITGAVLPVDGGYLVTGI